MLDDYEMSKSRIYIICLKILKDLLLILYSLIKGKKNNVSFIDFSILKFIFLCYIYKNGITFDWIYEVGDIPHDP